MTQIIRIAARLFDPLGYIDVKPLPTNTTGDISRRATRVATLDGGAVITDRGYSDGDRTLVYRYKPVSREHDERAKRLVQLHELVAVGTPDGLFEAVAGPFEPGNQENRITLQVTRKLSGD